MFEDIFNKKFWLATIAAIAIIVLWDALFLKDINQQKVLYEQQEKVRQATVEANKIIYQEEKKSKSKANVRRIAIENDKIYGSLSLEAGRIDEIFLKDYNKDLNSSENVQIFAQKGTEKGYFFESGFVTNNVDLPNSETVWQTNDEKLTPDSPVILTWVNNQGVIFKKEISIDNKYLIKVKDIIIAPKELVLSPYALILRQGDPDVLDLFISHEGFVGYLGNSLERLDYKKALEKVNEFSSSRGYMGYTDKYWLSAIILNDSDNKRVRFLSFKNKLGDNNYQIDYKKDSVNIVPNQPYENESLLFVGPKEYNLINSYSKEYSISKFDDTIDFGWFFFFTKPMIQFLLFLYDSIGHFGIAMLIFTVIIRIVILPVAYKSYVSMAKMKELQPKMKSLKELHKDDLQKYNKELMSLYRKEKVNPLSGCLPILLQIPIFFSIYKVIFISIELRHSPFFGWVEDMSVKDPSNLFELFGLLPWGAPSFLSIGVWPILMGVTMFIQQKLSTATSTMDPLQKKILDFMPWMLVIILAAFPAGLVIYWTWSNVISIVQQLFINKKVSNSFGIKFRNINI